MALTYLFPLVLRIKKGTKITYKER